MRTPRSVEVARSNYDSSIAFVPDRYKAGVQGASWAEAAASDTAEKNWAAGVQRAVSNKTRVQGIRRAGDQAWRDGSLNKGAVTIGEAMRRSSGKYAENFGKVYNAAMSTIKSLPPRSTDAMANIDARLKPTVKAFQAAAIRK